MNTSHTIEHITQVTWQTIWGKQFYMNILYLLVSFPLGLAYFAFLVPSIVIGVSTTIIWIGVFILLFLMSCWCQIAIFERWIAMQWLQITIPPLSYRSSRRVSLWQRLQDQLQNSMTWKTLAYLLLKLPLGFFAFIFTVVLLLSSIFIVIVSSFLAIASTPFFVLFIIFQDETQLKDRVQRYILFAATGFGLSFVTIYLLHQFTLIAEWLATSLLGMSDTARRIEEAEMQAEEEREKAMQADLGRRQLVVNISHELRAPIASVSGHLESLLISTHKGTTAPSPEALYKYLSIAHQEVKRLALLVDDLLSLARMESGELRLDIKPVAANEAVEEVYQSLNLLALHERRVTLVRGCTLHPLPVMADYDRLIQILLNLVRNAISCTSAGGIVSITLEPADEQHLALIVADNGIGIPDKDLQHIFERFYRVDASRTRATGGFGLGLAIVHDLVNAMGGNITVESTEGQGSRFCVLLRIASSGH